MPPIPTFSISPFQQTHRRIRRTVARKFSIGRLCVSAVGLWACARGLTLYKLTKTQLVYSVSCFNLVGGLGALFGGLSPQKPSCADGTENTSVNLTRSRLPFCFYAFYYRWVSSHWENSFALQQCICIKHSAVVRSWFVTTTGQAKIPLHVCHCYESTRFKPFWCGYFI